MIKKSKLRSKVLALVLAVAVAITMCPLAAGSVYAAEGDVEITGQGVISGTYTVADYESEKNDDGKVPLSSMRFFADTRDEVILDFIGTGDTYKVSKSYYELKQKNAYITIENGKLKLVYDGNKQKNLEKIVAGTELFTVTDMLNNDTLHYTAERLTTFTQGTVSEKSGASISKVLFNNKALDGKYLTVTGETNGETPVPLLVEDKYEEFFGSGDCIIYCHNDKADLISSDASKCCYNISDIKVEQLETPTVSIEGSGVNQTKSYTMEEFKSLCGDFKMKDVVYYALNHSDTYKKYTCSGIYVKDLLKIAGTKSNLDTICLYSDETHTATYSIAEMSVVDMNGNPPMLLWKEAVEVISGTADNKTNTYDLPKFVVGQSYKGEKNNPKWMSDITKIIITESAPTNFAAAGSAYVVTKAGQTVSLQKPANKKKVTIPATVSNSGVTYKVTGISASAFKGSKKVKTLTVKTKNLTKASVKGSLKGSKVKTVKVKVGKKKENKKYVKKYKKIFKKKNSGKKVRVKR